MSDILDDLKMMADHCDQENGGDPGPLSLLLIRAIAEIRKQRGELHVGEVPMPDDIELVLHQYKLAVQVADCALNTSKGQIVARETLRATESAVLRHLRTYGDAREAAGYAAGVTSGAKQMFDALQFAAANTSDTEWDDRLCEYSESALESASPEAHAEWKNIQRVAKESHQQGYAAGVAAVRDYAVMHWKDEVKNRPLQNIHRRTLDDVWRQVIAHTGGDPVALIGPCHDALVALRGEVK